MRLPGGRWAYQAGGRDKNHASDRDVSHLQTLADVLWDIDQVLNAAAKKR
jgi:hypothetical protein